jgi:hypothetical protein
MKQIINLDTFLFTKNVVTERGHCSADMPKGLHMPVGATVVPAEGLFLSALLVMKVEMPLFSL